MSRVPNSGAAEMERQKFVARLERKLAALERIPAARPEAEHADERAADIRAMIKDPKTEEQN